MDDGSVTVVLAAVIGLLAVLAAGIGGLAQIQLARDTAQLAADSAALAAAPVTFRPFGATGSAIEEAGRFAAANGATLTGCSGCEFDASWNPRVVQVEVAVEVDVLGLGSTTVSAVSAAEFDPIGLLGTTVATTGEALQ